LKNKTQHRSQPFLSLTHATFRLGDRLIFQNTSRTLRRSEHWAIVGPNGSGKSLLGDALRSKLPLVEGELTYHFKPPPGFTAEDCIGHIAFEDRKQTIHDRVAQSRWQSFEQDEADTVREILSYEKVMDVNPFEISEARGSHKTAFECRRARATKLLGIQPLLDRKFMVLSNGETQKVLLARALCLPLRLLILDEPFTGLDAKSRLRFRKVLQKLMSGPLRIILISTDLASLPPGITHILRVENCAVVRCRRRRLPRHSSRATAGKETLIKIGSPKISRKKPVQSLLTSSPTRQELVRMRDVTVKYGDITIFKNINWTIRAGESWALLGPNGSGKTTLLSLILGDHPQAYSNYITVFGQKIGSGISVWDLKQKIGWVSPELHLHFQDSFTCLETVESGFHDTIGLYDKVTPSQRREALRWLKRFGLTRLANAPLYELSAGLQRTVLLARALVKRPALLILDEPCQGLDPEHRAAFLQTLNSLLQSGGETAIYVTHEQQEIPRSVRRVLELVLRPESPSPPGRARR
jgi:molybdate transport system ATP-binding protein